ncbi:GspE/PulE family protein [Edwardsiella piscicida]|uniref:GspE/PulE family protein n=1 Tax=Edwardsiella piscicida TaxID=1263550 RepID=UPI00054CBA5B|nr:ATPase, T2SS/T4P/T4SS family [Edwardsiella piscicida]ELM3657626.1 Flp pilus assembly complex ATPase component TadA [Edwardsiella piscicida]ELM3735208.1 Flp pilus assembly complex ATPase component TadA [Edwardsiella piscicida]QBB11796.1 type II secretion system protein GspE [Edwardsiella piscicida]UCQ38482.1 Flp pilus assembly complex ATPase component TadA [Edwardsiella piscicida]UCQ41815.1 Flp pilus assembly complex ATPase component TadA [Edwardsiella piscicida]
MSDLQRLCRRYRCRLLHQDRHSIIVGGLNEAPAALLEAIRFATGLDAQWRPLSRRQSEEEEALYPATEDTQTAPQLEQLLLHALRRRASDIHLEPLETRGQVRLRIDGVLHPLADYPTLQFTRLVTRLKVLAGLDIAERRLPQDGQLRIPLSEQTHSFRLSTLPTLHGEKAVLRQVSTRETPRSLARLGLSPAQRQTLAQALAQPQGLILVTGPTGSGKTATLYAGLRRLNAQTLNICSVEDPIETPLENINQTAIAPRAGLQFATVLRALLRQDPDVIMIGEIRDETTAHIAVNAAQTGHLVLSTLHTNSAAQTLTRLLQLGIAPYLLADSLLLVIAQRLVRRLCRHCRQREPDAVRPSWLPGECAHCSGGYRGRRALFELLTPTPTLRQAMRSGADSARLQQLAEAQGMLPLHTTAQRLAEQGKTSWGEVLRVLGPQA